MESVIVILVWLVETIALGVLIPLASHEYRKRIKLEQRVKQLESANNLLKIQRDDYAKTIINFQESVSKRGHLIPSKTKDREGFRI